MTTESEALYQSSLAAHQAKKRAEAVGLRPSGLTPKQERALLMAGYSVAGKHNESVLDWDRIAADVTSGAIFDARNIGEKTVRRICEVLVARAGEAAMTPWINVTGETLHQREADLLSRWQGACQPVALSLDELTTPLIQWERGHDARYCGGCGVFVMVRRTDAGQYPCPTCGAGTEDRELPW